ncbi:cAMP-binding domain of CRP or a regulatory subunit of cAMP-dependent protein kinases [Solimonas aquatica]|uniref:cAMP-binding domain of CRP or a regulatory subunit of cAMP-dependent protein kinases n=2 Tax=Solimonas aquatica TaxID=489703 RepID=A0A1H9LS14_9GAMM|nr:Crp/Fnr family transcriptional regulator [Solimonas aquatica]SER14226.1 cAMP-binding domain of CRP or a regulatory subunit of cAMP-dependent protein kinases [Solimonas aquatica]
MRADPQIARAMSAHGWFHELAPAHQAHVLARVRLQHFAAGEVLAHRKAPTEDWIGVHTGLVKLAVYNAAGDSCTFSGVPAGGWFGEGSVLKRELRRYDVIALRASDAIFLPVDDFHFLLDHSLPFSGFVIRQLNERMGEFIAAIQNQRLLSVEGQVAAALSQLFNPQLYPFTAQRLELSQEELGLLTGLSRQRVNRALRELERLQLLRLAYNRIEVLDLERLRAYAQRQI